MRKIVGEQIYIKIHALLEKCSKTSLHEYLLDMRKIIEAIRNYSVLNVDKKNKVLNELEREYNLFSTDIPAYAKTPADVDKKIKECEQFQEGAMRERMIKYLKIYKRELKQKEHKK